MTGMSFQTFTFKPKCNEALKITTKNEFDIDIEKYNWNFFPRIPHHWGPAWLHSTHRPVPRYKGWPIWTYKTWSLPFYLSTRIVYFCFFLLLSQFVYRYLTSVPLQYYLIISRQNAEFISMNFFHLKYNRLKKWQIKNRIL